MASPAARLTATPAAAAARPSAAVSEDAGGSGLPLSVGDALLTLALLAGLGGLAALTARAARATPRPA